MRSPTGRQFRMIEPACNSGSSSTTDGHGAGTQLGISADSCRATVHHASRIGTCATEPCRSNRNYRKPCLAAKTIRLPLASRIPPARTCSHDVIQKWPSADQARKCYDHKRIDPDYGPVPRTRLSTGHQCASGAGVVVHCVYSAVRHISHSLWQINWDKTTFRKLAEERSEFFGGDFQPCPSLLSQRAEPALPWQHILTFLAQGTQAIAGKTKTEFRTLLVAVEVTYPRQVGGLRSVRPRHR